MKKFILSIIILSATFPKSLAQQEIVIPVHFSVAAKKTELWKGLIEFVDSNGQSSKMGGGKVQNDKGGDWIAIANRPVDSVLTLVVRPGLVGFDISEISVDSLSEVVEMHLSLNRVEFAKEFPDGLENGRFHNIIEIQFKFKTDSGIVSHSIYKSIGSKFWPKHIRKSLNKQRPILAHFERMPNSPFSVLVFEKVR